MKFLKVIFLLAVLPIFAAAQTASTVAVDPATYAPGFSKGKTGVPLPVDSVTGLLIVQSSGGASGGATAANQVTGGPQTGTGAVTATTQRVTLASDQSTIAVNLVKGLTVAGALYNSTNGLVNTDIISGSVSGWYDAEAYLGRSLACVIATTASTSGTLVFEQTDDTTLDPSGFALNLQDASVTTDSKTTTQVLAASTLYRREAPILHRYIRFRLSAAITAGSVRTSVVLSPVNYVPRQLTVIQSTANSLTTSATLAAGANLVGDVGAVARGTTGGVIAAASRLISAAATTNGTIVKGSAGRVYKITGQNAATTVKYLKLYNLTSVTVGSSAVSFTLVLPPSTVNGGVFEFNLCTYGVFFSTGIFVTRAIMNVISWL